VSKSVGFKILTVGYSRFQS